jgi:hypothetical protein
MQIRTTQDFKQAIRNGAYAWPGAYPLYFICEDGEALSFKAAAANAKLVLRAIRLGHDAQWRVVALEPNGEDDELVCAHTNERIECAYE